MKQAESQVYEAQKLNNEYYYGGRKHETTFSESQSTNFY